MILLLFFITVCLPVHGHLRKTHPLRIIDMYTSKRSAKPVHINQFFFFFFELSKMQIESNLYLDGTPETLLTEIIVKYIKKM